MPESDEYKYWAFISYSHRDRRWGDWLHRALETYRVPRHLVGQLARHGEVPRRAFPVFRDREELPGSSDLGENLHNALVASRYLVVICSPSSARSIWVGEEIKQFKALGREDRVLCLIVDGEPNAGDEPGLEAQECFPEAVRFKVGPDAVLTAERTEPIAADARKDKDGRSNARLKLLAGILGVDYDALKQRDQARRVRRMQIVTVAAAVLVAILTFLSVGFYQAKEEAEAARDVADRAREVAQIERRRALDNLRESHNHRGFNAFLNREPDRALFFLNEARRIAPGQRFTRHAMADAWRRVKNVRTRIAGEEQAARAVAFSADGRRLAVQDEVGRVRLHDLGTGERLLATAGRIQRIPAPLMAANLEALAGFRALPDPDDPNHVERAIVRYDGLGRALGAPMPWPKALSDVDSMVLSPSGRYLAYAVDRVGEDEIVKLHDFERPAAADVALDLGDDAFGNSGWTFTPDDRFLLQNRHAGSGPFFVIVRDLHGVEQARLEAASRVEAVAVSGDLVVLGDASGGLTAFDLENPGQPVWRDGDSHRSGVTVLAFDAGGTRLLSADSLGGVAVRDSRSASATWQRPDSEHGVIRAGAISADGRRVAVAFARTVLVYDLDGDGRLIRDWHRDDVTALAFSPDATRLAAATETGAVTLWEAGPADPPRHRRFALPAGESYTGVLPLGAGLYLMEGSAARLVDTATGAVSDVAGGAQRFTLVPRDRLLAFGFWGQSRIAVVDGSGQPTAVNDLAHAGDAAFAGVPAGYGASLVVAMPGARLVAIDSKALTLPGEIPLPPGTGDAWSIRFAADAGRGFVGFADGRLLEFTVGPGGVEAPVWHRPIAGGATPELIDVSAAGDRVLLSRDANVHLYQVGERRGLRLPRADLVAARFVGAGDAPLVATVDVSGAPWIWSLDGDRLAQGIAAPVETPAASLGTRQVQAGAGIAALGADAIATSVDDRVYLWRLSDARLIWRSENLVPSGWEPVVTVIEAAPDGAGLIVAVGSAGAGSSFTDLLGVPVPGDAPGAPVPSIEVVDAHVRDALGYVYRGGVLMSRAR